MSTNNKITIRRPNPDDDIDAITAIYADAVLNTTATYELDPPSRGEMHKRITNIQEGSFPCFVSEETRHEGPIMQGYAYTSPFRPRPAYRFTVEHSVYIASDARGRGIRRLLMEVVITECEKLGFRQMVAVIGDGRGENASVESHRKLGFRHSGVLEGSG